jgi:hypothetical protein
MWGKQERLLSPFDRTVDAISAHFAQAGTPLPPDRAQALAHEIATYDGLEPAIAALTHDEAYRVLDDALGYRTLLSERDDPDRRIGRLLSDAVDFDARAEPAWAEAADWRGRAAFQHARGQTALAEQFERRALAAERVAAKYEEQAFDRRLKAAELKAGRSLSQALRDLAA